jgi:RNA-directed DNA polymerase
MNPTGGAISRPVINSSVFPLYSLKDVLSTENIRSAWKQVRGNRGAPGIDDLSVDVFPTQVRPKWMEIKRQILAGEYFPQPVKRVEIPKANGGIRLLGIPTVQDRLLQQGVSQVLGPVVYAQHGRDLMGCKSPVGKPLAFMILEPIMRHWRETSQQTANKPCS